MKIVRVFTMGLLTIAALQANAQEVPTEDHAYVVAMDQTGQTVVSQVMMISGSASNDQVISKILGEDVKRLKGIEVIRVADASEAAQDRALLIKKFEARGRAVIELTD